MVALAVLTIVLWLLWEVRRGAKLSYDTVLTAAVVGIPSGIIVSRFFHIIDRTWGHLTIRMCGHVPFSAMVMLNGHEWVACRARRESKTFSRA